MHLNHTLVSEPRPLDPYLGEGSGETAVMEGHVLVPGSSGTISRREALFWKGLRSVG